MCLSRLFCNFLVFNSSNPKKDTPPSAPTCYYHEMYNSVYLTKRVYLVCVNDNGATDDGMLPGQGDHCVLDLDLEGGRTCEGKLVYFYGSYVRN